MNKTGQTVFLSYASPAFARALRRGKQVAEAARCICDALRASGVEVWFDQSELVGGLRCPAQRTRPA